MSRGTEFQIGQSVTIDGRKVLADQVVPPRDGHPFRIRARRDVESAWATVDRTTGDVLILALACSYCNRQTDRRCCTVALCGDHESMHRRFEHASSDQGRYRAILNHPSPRLDLRFAPPIPPIEGLPRPRDPHLHMERRPHDVVRVINHVRRATVRPTEPDAVGAAVQQLLAAGSRLPSWRQFQWVLVDILARATWPGLLDAIGERDAARWLRDQPPVANARPTPLSNRLKEVDRQAFETLSYDTTAVGEAAASDALCGLWPGVPYTKGDDYGMLGYSMNSGSRILTHALTMPEGAERVGVAVAQTHRDAISITLAGLNR